MKQSFSAHLSNQVYVVTVETKRRSILRRLDNVYSDFEAAALRQRTMHLAADEHARIQAKPLFGNVALTQPAPDGILPCGCMGCCEGSHMTYKD